MPQIAFKSLILVDPMLLRKPRPDEPQLDLVSGAAKRRDIWLSREEALHSLQSRASFKIWDPRVLRIFVVGGNLSRYFMRLTYDYFFRITV